MAITLDGITLPTDLIWVDEYAHTPVKQSVSVAVNGALIVEAAAQTKGRPITLQGGDEAAWIDRATLELIRAKQYQPGLTMTLVHNGTSYDVLFVQPGGIEARPVIDYNIPDNADWYAVTFKFIEV
jgi:hypothetical protein